MKPTHIIRTVLFLGVVAFASVAMAILPPHVTGMPGHGMPLVEGRIVKLFGYTFGPGLRAQVLDAGGQPVQTEQFLWTRVQCNGRPGACANAGVPAMGAEQVYGALSIKLPPPATGASYEVTLLDAVVQVDTHDGAYVVR